MIRLRSLLALTGLLALALPLAAEAVQVNRPPPTANAVEIGFSAHAGGPPASATLTAPGRARRYRIVLEPQYDRDRHVIGLNLQLCRIGQKAQCGLLDAPARPRGSPSSTFLAKAFARRPTRGRQRRFELPRLGMDIDAQVLNVAARPLPSRSGPTLYDFEALTLRVATTERRLPRG